MLLRVISNIANTIDTTVIIEVAMLLRMICATPGSCCDGNSTVGIQLLTSLNDSSKDESKAPTVPSTSAIVSGRMRKPPRKAYSAERNSDGRRSNMLNTHLLVCKVEFDRSIPISAVQRDGA